VTAAAAGQFQYQCVIQCQMRPGGVGDFAAVGRSQAAAPVGEPFGPDRLAALQHDLVKDGHFGDGGAQVGEGLVPRPLLVDIQPAAGGHQLGRGEEPAFHGIE